MGAFLSGERALALIARVPGWFLGRNEKLGDYGEALLVRLRRRYTLMGARNLYSAAKLWSLAHSISPEDKARLRAKFLRCERISIRIKKAEEFLDFLLQLFFVVGSIMGLIYVSRNAQVFGINLADFAEWFWAIPALIFFGLIILLFMAVQLELDAIGIAVFLVFIIFGLLMYLDALVTTVACLFSGTIPNCPQNMVLVSSPIVITILVVVVSSIASYLQSLVKSRLDRRFPEAMTADHLFQVILRLEKGQSAISSISERRSLMQEIERTAAIIRSRLFAKLRSSDAQVNVMRDRLAQEISREIGVRATWLITPKPDTAEYLRSYFTRMLVALLSGAWDGLLAREDELKEVLSAESADSSWTERVWWGIRALFRQALMALKTIIVAGAPAAGFYFADRYAIFQLDHPMRDYVQAGLILWMVIVLLSAFDPLLRERVSTVGEIIGKIRGAK